MGDMELGMTFDGRAGDPNIIDEASRKKIAAYIDERVGEFRCPDHNKAPTIVVTGDSRGSDNGINAAILGEMATEIASLDVDFVLFPGDLVTGSSDPLR